jgi:hypothetical protein
VKLHYLTRNELDTVRYDKCIEFSVNGSLFAYSWYLDIVAPNWDVIVDEHYKCVMPLPYIIRKHKKQLIHPNFIPHLGIISNYLLVPSLISLFYNELLTRFDEISLILNKMNNIFDENDTNILSAEYWEKDLTTAYNQHNNNYLNTQYEQINFRNTNNYKFNIELEFSQLLHFWAVEPFQSSHYYNENDVEILKQLVKELNARNLIKVLGININDQLSSISVWVWSNMKIFLLMQLASKESIENNLPLINLDYFIQEHSQKTITLSLPAWIQQFNINPSALEFNAYFYPWVVKERKNFLQKIFEHKV